MLLDWFTLSKLDEKSKIETRLKQAKMKKIEKAPDFAWKKANPNTKFRSIFNGRKKNEGKFNDFWKTWKSKCND